MVVAAAAVVTMGVKWKQGSSFLLVVVVCVCVALVLVKRAGGMEVMLVLSTSAIAVALWCVCVVDGKRPHAAWAWSVTSFCSISICCQAERSNAFSCGLVCWSSVLFVADLLFFFWGGRGGGARREGAGARTGTVVVVVVKVPRLLRWLRVEATMAGVL